MIRENLANLLSINRTTEVLERLLALTREKDAHLNQQLTVVSGSLNGLNSIGESFAIATAVLESDERCSKQADMFSLFSKGISANPADQTPDDFDYKITGEQVAARKK